MWHRIQEAIGCGVITTFFMAGVSWWASLEYTTAAQWIAFGLGVGAGTIWQVIVATHDHLAH
jgi:hypothetical protein